MKVAVLGSGSRGNAVALAYGGASLLIDAGFGPRTLARRAAAVGISLDGLAGVLVTHEHQDHARGAASLARRTGAPVAGTPGTLRALGLPNGARSVSLVPQVPHRMRPFAVTAERVAHDAAEPAAVVVEADGVRVGVACDVGRATGALRLLLRSCTVLVLEANHDDVLLRTGPYPAVVRQRIAGSTGHLSNRAAAELAAALWHPGLATVVLSHLSAHCNTPDLARRTVGAALRRRGFTGALVVADQSAPLLVPFGQAAML